MKRLSIPVLSGALLIATVAGVAFATPSARPQEQAWRVLTVNSQSCIPEYHGDQWYHDVDILYCVGPACFFVCPVYFPAAGEQAVGAVNVKRVTMYAYDAGVGKYAEFELRKTYPPTKAGAQMANAVTTDSDADPQTVMDTIIAYNPVYRVHGPYIYLTIWGGNVNVYGFYIHYTWL